MKYRAKTHPKRGMHFGIMLHEAKGDPDVRAAILKAHPHVVDAYRIDKPGDPLVLDEPNGRDFSAEVEKWTKHHKPAPGDYWVVIGDGFLCLHRKDVFEAKYEPHKEAR